MSRRAPAPPPRPSSATGRTVVVVAVVAAVAALILARGFGNEKGGGSATAGSSKPAKASSTSSTSPASAATPTVGPTLPPATIAPGSIKVLVLNGNGVGGSAAKRVTDLKALGYANAIPDNATKNTYEKSAVYYQTADFKAAAEAIGALMGGTVPVSPPPAEPYVDATKLTGVNIVILLGKDKANEKIGGAPGAAAQSTTTPALTAAQVTSTTAG